MRASTFKAIAIAAFTAVTANSAASAADMAPRYTKAPPPVVEVWAWDKFYVGLNGGYSWGRSDTSGTFYNNLTGVQLSPTQSSVIHLDGWVFGGQVGNLFRHQIQGVTRMHGDRHEGTRQRLRAIADRQPDAPASNIDGQYAHAQML